MHDHTRQQLELFDKEFVKHIDDHTEPVFIDAVGSVGPIRRFIQQALKSQAEEIESRLFTTTISKSSDVYEVWYEEMKPILNEYIKVD